MQPRSLLLLLPLTVCFAPTIGAAAEPATPAARPVRVATLTIAPIPSTLVFSGTVQARRQADLAFRVPGKVTALPIDIGDQLHHGQLIARLDQADLQLAQESAEAALQAATADAANARAEFARYDRLGANSPAYLPSEYDKRASASRMADARATQAQRQLALSRSQRSYGDLTADADGIVTALPIQIGQVLAAGQTVATLAHTDEIEIVADIPENRLTDVRGAKDVAIALWAAPSQPLHGHVREVGALADPATRTFAVRIRIEDAPQNLLALGMTASVTFGKPTPPVGRLPATALTDDHGAPSVWVLDQTTRHATLRPVQLAGYAADGTVIIAHGLQDGETVITAGAGQIDPTMPLTPWTGAAR